MKKCLLLVVVILLLSSLLGVQHCTFCNPDEPREKRTLMVTPVSEDSCQEEEHYFLALDKYELVDIEDEEQIPDCLSERACLDLSFNQSREVYPSVKAENKYVTQPRQVSSFKAFRVNRDYRIEDSVNISGQWFSDYVYSGDMLFRTRLLTIGDSLLLENPALNVTLTDLPGKAIVETAFCQQTIDFKSGQILSDLSYFDRRDKHFKRFTKDYHTSISFDGQQTVHSFTMDFPDEEVAYRDNVCRWLSQLVSEAYVGDLDLVDSTENHASLYGNLERWQYRSTTVSAESLGHFSSNRYFTFKRMQYPHPFDAYAYLISVYDWRLCLRNDRFLTYQQYIFDYDGGAHGGFSSSLRSYDFVHQEEIDSRYLFRPECMDSVKSLMLDEASRSESFLRRENIRTLNQLYYNFVGFDSSSRTAVIAKMQLPVPGLSEEGVVFSYPPYAIGAYSSGEFHFVIPYGRLLPYLTSKAKWCLGLY